MCETHDPTGEPDAVNPPVRFGERRLETEPWRGVRHRHCKSRRQQLPPSAYRYRASRRLYPFPQPTPACSGGEPAARCSPQGDDRDSQAVAFGLCRVTARAGLDAEPALGAFDLGCVAEPLSVASGMEVSARRSAAVGSGVLGSLRQDVLGVWRGAGRTADGAAAPLLGCGATHDRGDSAALNLYRQGLAADVEGASDGRRAAAPGEASTRRIVPDVSG